MDTEKLRKRYSNIDLVILEATWRDDVLKLLNELDAKDKEIERLKNYIDDMECAEKVLGK